jgi:hypothetical protein
VEVAGGMVVEVGGAWREKNLRLRVRRHFRCHPLEMVPGGGGRGAGGMEGGKPFDPCLLPALVGHVFEAASQGVG